MYELSGKLDLSINIKFPTSKTLLIFLVDFSSIPSHHNWFEKAKNKR